MVAFIEFAIGVFYSLSAAGSEMLEFLNRGVNIPEVGISFTYFDVLFGVGLPVYFSYAVAKFLIPIS